MKMWIGTLLLVWIAIGTVAAAQRGYFREDMALDCRTSATIGTTMLAGPLNYLGVDPHVGCTAPRPSA
jgi:hypothetical protein